MPTLDELKTGVFDYTVHRLGAGVVDVELCQDQLETAYQQALGVYKQRSQNATEESYAWVELQENINENDFFNITLSLFLNNTKLLDKCKDDDCILGCFDLDYNQIECE